MLMLSPDILPEMDNIPDELSRYFTNELFLKLLNTVVFENIEKRLQDNIIFKQYLKQALMDYPNSIKLKVKYKLKVVMHRGHNLMLD